MKLILVDYFTFLMNAIIHIHMHTHTCTHDMIALLPFDSRTFCLF